MRMNSLAPLVGPDDRAVATQCRDDAWRPAPQKYLERVRLGGEPANQLARQDRGQRDVDNKTPTPLVTAYFERRLDLRRFFLARLHSMTEAEDLVQDLYLKVTTTPSEDEIRNPGAYLYRLAANLMLDRLRQQHRTAARDDAWRKTHHVLAAAEDIADIPDAEAAVAARQQLQRVITALEALPERTQRVFRLHKFEGLGHAEIASRLGMSRSAVEKHMIDALRHLVAKVRR